MSERDWAREKVERITKNRIGSYGNDVIAKLLRAERARARRVVRAVRGVSQSVDVIEACDEILKRLG